MRSSQPCTQFPFGRHYHLQERKLKRSKRYIPCATRQEASSALVITSATCNGCCGGFGKKLSCILSNRERQSVGGRARDYLCQGDRRISPREEIVRFSRTVHRPASVGHVVHLGRAPKQRAWPGNGVGTARTVAVSSASRGKILGASDCTLQR